MGRSETEFYAALAHRESEGNKRVVNEYGFMGLYQMGPPALQDAGYMDSNQRWTGRHGVRSQSDFLNNADAQNDAVRRYHTRLWGYIPQKIRKSVGTTVKNIKITKSGLLAGAHLRGQGGVTRFIDSNGEDDDVDEIKTPCSEYIKQFEGYDVSRVIGE